MDTRFVRVTNRVSLVECALPEAILVLPPVWTGGVGESFMSIVAAPPESTRCADYPDGSEPSGRIGDRLRAELVPTRIS